MSLLHPTPGEVCDRNSILMLKLISFRSAGMDDSRILQEWHELEDYFESQFAEIDCSAIRQELSIINGRIWDAENSMRSTRENTVEHIALVAKNIARYNDERNRLIREIDKAYGCENPVEEKIYSGERK